MRYLILLLSLLGGCGYHWNLEESIGPTVSVGFIEGDEEGLLTNEISSALASSGLVKIVSSGGDYDLCLEILDFSTEKIGFRIDPQKVFGKVRKNLLATEGRREIKAQVSLLSHGKIACGPFQIAADAEYDYVDGDSIQDLTFVSPSGQTITVLPFSLGQLEPIDSAEKAALKPIYQKLAKKIVDAIAFQW